MNATASDKLDLNILSDPANVSAVRTSIEHFCAVVGLDETAQQEIGLAVNEALANVIRHAYKGAKDRPVRIVASRNGRGVQIDIRDWGSGVDPSVCQLPKVDLRTPGGVGMMCIQKLMDEVKYLQQPDGMLLEMIRHRNGKSKCSD
jgi:anti-sigma regulatory factor (Ser/Thr protein kinase)